MCVCVCVCVSYWDRECCCYIRCWEYKNIPCPQVSLGLRRESATYTKHKDIRAITEIYTNYLLQFDFSGKQTVRWKTNLVFRMFMGIDYLWKARGDGRRKSQLWSKSISPDPEQSSKIERTHSSCPELGWQSQVFLFPTCECQSWAVVWVSDS